MYATVFNQSSLETQTHTWALKDFSIRTTFTGKRINLWYQLWSAFLYCNKCCLPCLSLSYLMHMRDSVAVCQSSTEEPHALWGLEKTWQDGLACWCLRAHGGRCLSGHMMSFRLTWQPTREGGIKTWSRRPTQVTRETHKRHTLTLQRKTSEKRIFHRHYCKHESEMYVLLGGKRK